MRVLVFTQYYWPETFRITGVVKALQSGGCAVTVVTGKPNYPEGVLYSGYSAWKLEREKHPDGYDVLRVPLVARGRGSRFRLAANYVSFVVSALVLAPWLLRGMRFDVIFVYAPSPIFQVLPAIALKRIKGIPLITWVQDLWPQSLDATGFVRHRWLLSVLEKMVAWIYRQNDLLLGQSRCFVQELRKLAGAVRVEYFPNPGEEGFDAVLRSPEVRFAAGFNIVFAGNLGTVQAIETVLAAAVRLTDYSDVRFVLVGSGSRERWLRDEVARQKLNNVVFLGRLPPSEMPGVLSEASALLITLRRSPILSCTVPAKLQVYLAAGKPIVAAMDGEGADIVRSAGAGVVAPAEDPIALAEAILRLRSLTPAEQACMGQAGRDYYDKHFTPSVLTADLLEHFGHAIAAAAEPERI